jgi:hypothetical protein
MLDHGLDPSHPEPEELGPRLPVSWTKPLSRLPKLIGFYLDTRHLPSSLASVLFSTVLGQNPTSVLTSSVFASV